MQVELSDIELRLIKNAIDVYEEEYSYQWSDEGVRRNSALRAFISTKITYPMDKETTEFFTHFIKSREQW